MRIVAFSDTHGYHDGMVIPEGDLLIHCGDLSFHGHLESVREFDEWMGTLPHPHKVAIAGNHDRVFEENEQTVRKAIQHFTYLQDESVEIDGLKIWGAPWQPEFFDWAFNLPRGEALARVWAQIPEDTDLLLTHGPPWGYGDRTNRGERVGCEDLMARLDVVKPVLHCFGHIHEDPGVWTHGETTIANVCTPFGNGEPRTFELEQTQAGWRIRSHAWAT